MEKSFKISNDTHELTEKLRPKVVMENDLFGNIG